MGLSQKKELQWRLEAKPFLDLEGEPDHPGPCEQCSWVLVGYNFTFFVIVKALIRITLNPKP